MSVHEPTHAAQIRAASTAFLRWRPLIAGIGAALNALVLSTAELPEGQLRAAGAVTLGGVALFAAESIALRARLVTERWLASSLSLTVLGLGVAATITGGLTSPMLPLLLAPIVVALAAFGSSAASHRVLGLGALVLLALHVAPTSLVGAEVPSPQRASMSAISLAATAVLLWVGVGSLAAAHARAARTLRSLREGVIEEAAARARETEALGAKVAHEIRNPLTSIKALVQVQARSASDPREQRRYEVVLSEVARIEETLTGYLSLARPLAELAPERVELGALLRELAALVEARAEAQGVRVDLSVSSLVVRADPRRIREAVLNLLTNAIEAMTRSGVVVLACARDGEHARIEVRDEGRGMSATEVERVGTPFFTTREGGTGLGVALARSVARMHGGELVLESGGEGKGTRASIVLPLGAGEVE